MSGKIVGTIPLLLEEAFRAQIGVDAFGDDVDRVDLIIEDDRRTRRLALTVGEATRLRDYLNLAIHPDSGERPEAVTEEQIKDEFARAKAKRDEAIETQRLKDQLMPEASEEVANVVENARRVVASRCSCADCVAIIDRAIANLAEWRELLTRKPTP